MNTPTNLTETHEAAARYQARKAKRIAAKRARKTNPAHLAAMARRAASATDATRHYSQVDDLITNAIISRM